MRSDIWRKQAEEDLKIYEARKQSLVNIPDQIKELEEKLTSIRSQSADSVSVKGGGGFRRVVIGPFSNRFRVRFPARSVVTNAASF